MGVVYGGKYNAKRIKLDGRQRVLYIKDGRNKIPLIGDAIESYYLANGDLR